MAHPYLLVDAGATGNLDIKPFFAGLYGQNGNAVTPTYTVNADNSLISASINGSLLTAVAGKERGVSHVRVTVNDGSTFYTQSVGIVVIGSATGIYTLTNDSPETHDAPCYNLAGLRISQPAKGLYIQNGKKMVAL